GEMRPRPGQHDHLYRVVRRGAVETVVEAICHRRILRVAILRPVHGDASDRAFPRVKHDVTHLQTPIALLARAGTRHARGAIASRRSSAPAPTLASRTHAARIRSYSPSPRDTGSRSVRSAGPRRSRVSWPPRSPRPRPAPGW